MLSSALEKEMAAYSSVLAWRIPGTGEPGVLPSVGSHRVGHDWSNLAAAAAAASSATKSMITWTAKIPLVWDDFSIEIKSELLETSTEV